MWTSVMRFFKEQQRRPSKYKPEEHYLRNWVKYNIRRMRRGDLPADRQQRMQQLIEEGERLRRVNQYCATATAAYNITTTNNPTTTYTLWHTLTTIS